MEKEVKMGGLKGKLAIVTGAGQGLGEQITRMLVSEGVNVIACDVKVDQVKKLSEELSTDDVKVTAMLVDVSDPGSIKDVFSKLKEEGEKVDILVNNAGIDITKPIGEIDPSSFGKVIDVNLKGPFIMSKYMFEQVDDKGGNIINIASTAAKRAWANASAYHASKWGLVGLSHALHVEGRDKKIKVTAIVAGGMRTPFILERFPDTPLDVLQDPKNVANAVRFALMQPEGTVIPEMMVIPEKETSWP